MKINRNHSGTTPFERLRIGDVFTFEEHIYMVTNSESGDTIVDLESGEMTYIDGIELVTLHPNANMNLE